MQKIYIGRFDRIVLGLLALLGLVIVGLSYSNSPEIEDKTPHRRLVYLSPAFENSDLYLIDPSASTPPERLTHEVYGVYDFAVSQNGNLVAYSADRDASGSTRDIWVLNLSTRQRKKGIECTDVLCNTPAWYDNRIIAYEQRAAQTSNNASNIANPEIWLGDINTQQTKPLKRNADGQIIRGSYPKWSPQTQQLAYHDVANEQIMIVEVNFLNAMVQNDIVINNVQNGLFTWAGDGKQLAYVQQQFDDALNLQQLMRADLQSDSITALGEFRDRQFSQPVWSHHISAPKIAISIHEKAPNANLNASGYGQQIWVINPSLNTALAATTRINGDNYSYGGLKWQGDDIWIAAVRNTASFLGEPEVWLVRSDGSETKRVAVNATLPDWVK